MKWVIIGLFGLGLAAAVCAAVLVASFNRGGAPDGTSADGIPVDATVLVASRDMDALVLLDAKAVATRSVPASAVPVGALTDPVQAVGKVLITSVKEGEALTPDSFISDASSAKLAASLKPGFRAVNVLLSDPMGVEGLLTPGSVVDVLASVEMKSADGARQEPVSLTLLQGVRVLAVGDHTIVTPGAGTATPSDNGVRSRPSVTLLVDAHQAERLKLAMQEGSVTLAMRNPTDSTRMDVSGTALASLSPIFADASTASRQTAAAAASAPKSTSPSAAPLPAPAALLQPEMPKVLQRQWETVILRGGVAETRTFPLNESGHDR